jgi:hypothetical protein
MGWDPFGGKDKTYVYTSISRVSDSKDYVSFKKKGVIRAVARNESIPEHIINNLVVGAGFSAKRAYKYGGDGYIFGKPNDTLISQNTIKATINIAISNYLMSIGATAIYYTYYGAANYYHSVFQLLVYNHGLKLATSILENLTLEKEKEVKLMSVDLIVNPLYVDDYKDNYFPLSLYSCGMLMDASVPKIGAEMTYRWEDKVVTYDTDSSTEGPTLIASSSSSYEGGPVNYTDSDSETIELAPLPPVTVNTTKPAVPPFIYETIRIATESTVTPTETIYTSYTYTASTVPGITAGTLLTEVYKTVNNAIALKITTITPTQKTDRISDSLSFTEEQNQNTYSMGAYKNSAGNVVFFSYKMGSGSIPSLENVMNTSYTTPGEYMPRLYLRWAAQPGNVDPLSTAYLHGKKMAKKIGMQYDDVIEAVHSLEGRTQEDLDKIKSSFLMYGVQADASSQLELQYLFNYFEKWYGVVGGTVTSYSLETFNLSLNNIPTAPHSLIIEDSRFKTTLDLAGIWKRTVTSSTTPVGTYSMQKGTAYTSYVREGRNGSSTIYELHTWHTYRYQNTAGTYVEYHLLDLATKYYVEGGFATASGYTSNSADEKDVLYIPIDYSLVEPMNIGDQEELMYMALHIVTNALVLVHLKWYQTGFWQFVFLVVIVFAAVTGYLEAAKFLTAVIAIAGVSMIWAMELVYAALLKMLVAAIAVKVFVIALGDELAFLAALITAAYAAYSGQFDKALPYAKELMAYSQAVFKEIGTSIAGKLEDLFSEIKEFTTNAQAELDKLAELSKELDKPTEFADAFLRESSEQFYKRTIHTGNIGTKIYALQANYVTIALELPRKSYTFGA